MTTTQESPSTKTQLRNALRDRFILVRFNTPFVLGAVESHTWKRVPIPKDVPILRCQIAGVACFQLLVKKVVHFYESESGGELYRGLFSERVQVVRDLTTMLIETPDFAEQRKNLVDICQGCVTADEGDWDMYLKG